MLPAKPPVWVDRQAVGTKAFTGDAGQCAALLKGRAEELVRLLQQYECDALGLGLTLSRFEPESWKSLKEDWRKTFAQTPIETEVQVKITGAGRMYLPVSMEEGEQNG